jgi:hypothetical protein
MLGEDYDGSVSSSVDSGERATATMRSGSATPTATDQGSPSASASTPLTSVNAAEALCA